MDPNSVTNETPPGPSGLPVIGNTRQLSGNRLELMTETAREYGDVVRIDLVPGQSLYGLFHPDHVRHVLVDQNEHYIKGDFFQDRLSLLGDGLLTAEGETWRSQRHEIEPAFHPDRIAGYGETMLSFTDRLVDRWDLPADRDVHEDMMALTLEIVADALFGVDIRDSETEVGDALGTVMEHFRTQTGRPIEVPEWLPTGDNRRYRRAHETTAQSLTFTAYLLATHPTVERRLVSELDEELDGETPSVADLGKLPYLERVVRESMRLYPPVPGIVRQPTRDDEIGGYGIPEGATILLSQWVIHRDPRFYDNPLAFDPDRWKRQGRNERPGFAYFPFGGGPRRCVGDRFAMMEARLVLARLLQSVSFETVPETDLELTPSITLRPAGGLDLRITPRA